MNAENFSWDCTQLLWLNKNSANIRRATKIRAKSSQIFVPTNKFYLGMLQKVNLNCWNCLLLRLIHIHCIQNKTARSLHFHKAKQDKRYSIQGPELSRNIRAVEGIKDDCNLCTSTQVIPSSCRAIKKQKSSCSTQRPGQAEGILQEATSRSCRHVCLSGILQCKGRRLW